MAKQKDGFARITFRVVTAEPLPAGEQVFLAGNLPEFGGWQADGLPLTRIDDAVWAATVDLETGTRLEFKITRGRWETEAWDGPGPEPPNHRLTVAGDREFEYRVGAWKDRPPAAGA